MSQIDHISQFSRILVTTKLDLTRAGREHNVSLVTPAQVLFEAGKPAIHLQCRRSVHLDVEIWSLQYTKVTLYDDERQFVTSNTAN